MKRLLFTASIIFLLNSAKAQTFERIYGTNYESTTHLIQAIGGGYIMAGATTYPGAPSGQNSDILIVKTDSSGVMQWSEALRSPLDDEAMWIEAYNDSSYLICGNSYDNNSSQLYVFEIRIDTSGAILSQNLYKKYSTERTYCLRLTPDHGSILAGESLSNTSGLQMYLLKLDSLGGVQWSSSFGDQDQEYATSVMLTGDSGYILSGVARINSFVSSICVVKADSSGRLQWAKKYNTDPIQSKCLASRILPSNRGDGYIICGSTTNNQNVESMFLMKIDSIGDVVWQKTYRTVNTEWVFDAMNDDIGYTVCGSSENNTNGTENTIIMNVDETGSMKWKVGYEVADSSMSPSSILKSTNGRYLVSGTTDATTFGLPHIMLIRSDSTFNQGLCNMINPPLVEDSGLLVASSFNEYTIDTTISFNGSYSVSPGVQQDVICTGIISGVENVPTGSLQIYRDVNGNIVMGSKEAEGHSIVNMFDLQGRLLHSTQLEIHEGRNLLFENDNASINITEGAYVFMVLTTKGVYNEKVFIE